MKTIVRIENVGTEVILGRCTVREAMSILGLDHREWKTHKIKEDEKKVEYQLTQKPAPFVPKKISVSRREIEDALKVAADFTATGPLPLLQSVRITTAGTSLTICATDLERSWCKTIPVAGDAVDICVPLKLLYSEIKALHSNITIVEIERSEKAISVNGRCQLNVSSAEEFPEFPVVGGEAVSIHELDLKLKKVIPAVSKDETRYTLTGVFFDFEKGKLVATDGFRLHYEEIEAAPLKGVIVPRKTAALIVKYPGTEEINVSEKHISCRFKGGEMVSRLIDGQFAEYASVLEGASPGNTFEFDSKEFFKVLQGAIPVADSKAIILTVNGALQIETSNENGTYKWQIPCKSMKPTTIRYNFAFLADAINAYAGDGNVVIGFPDTYGATIVNGKALVMPVRI
jgi:DNA polymerase III sliding clamp (beta) subunit (PCNA family)